MAIENGTRFQHQGKGTIYTITKEGEELRVLWGNESGPGSTTYTIEQAEKNFSNGTWVKTNPPGKLLGYLAPMGFEMWRTIAGDLFTQNPDNPKVYRGTTGTNPYLPAELVETWTPSYEVEVFQEGNIIAYSSSSKDRDTIVKIKSLDDYRKNFIDINDNSWTYVEGEKGKFRLATPDEVEKFNAKVVIRGYTAELKHDRVCFGCVNLSKESLENYLYLITSDARARIMIEDVEITTEIINKLLKMFK